MSNCQYSVLRVLRNVSAWKNSPNKYKTLFGPAVSRQIHSGNVLKEDKTLDEKMNQAPYPFMSSLKGEVQSKQEESFFEYEEEWKYQSFVLFTSALAFLVYFTALRKEREVDIAIAKQLYQGLPALEVHDLRKEIEKRKKDGKDVTELEERLKVVLTPPQNRDL